MAPKKPDVDKPFACPQCPFRCKLKCNLGNHIKFVHSDEKPFRCHLCPYGAKAKPHLTAHVMTHSGSSEKKHACSHCKYKGVTAGQLRVHLRIHTGEKPFACQLCPYRASRFSHLNEHMAHRHTKEKPHACKQCPAAFVAPAELKIHLRCHTGERPYKCPVDGCDYATTRPEHLKCHNRIHTGDRPYACTLCDFKATQLTHLRTHVTRRHTKERKHKCSLCDYAGYSHGDLVAHTRIHTKEKPFKCQHPGCNYAASQGTHLVTHSRRHRRDDGVEVGVTSAAEEKKNDVNFSGGVKETKKKKIPKRRKAMNGVEVGQKRKIQKKRKILIEEKATEEKEEEETMEIHEEDATNVEKIDDKNCDVADVPLITSTKKVGDGEFEFLLEFKEDPSPIITNNEKKELEENQLKQHEIQEDCVIKAEDPVSQPGMEKGEFEFTLEFKEEKITDGVSANFSLKDSQIVDDCVITAEVPVSLSGGMEKNEIEFTLEFKEEESMQIVGENEIKKEEEVEKEEDDVEIVLGF